MIAAASSATSFIPGRVPSSDQARLVTAVNRVLKKVASNGLKQPTAELATTTRYRLTELMTRARDNANPLANVRTGYQRFITSLLANANANANANAKVSAQNKAFLSSLSANVKQATNSMNRKQIVENLVSHLNQTNKVNSRGTGAP
jgi:uncharacterized protein YqgV (UPF0045/DUF77 family)